MTFAAEGNAVLALPKARIQSFRLSSQGASVRAKILDFIIAYKRQHDGNSPSSRQIMEGAGLTSTAVVHWHLRKLEARGKLVVIRGSTRQIEVTGGRWTYTEAKGNAATGVLPGDP